MWMCVLCACLVCYRQVESGVRGSRDSQWTEKGRRVSLCEWVRACVCKCVCACVRVGAPLRKRWCFLFCWIKSGNCWRWCQQKERQIERDEKSFKDQQTIINSTFPGIRGFGSIRFFRKGEKEQSGIYVPSILKPCRFLQNAKLCAFTRRVNDSRLQVRRISNLPIALS